MMHGLAGSAALVVLSLKTAPSLPLGLGYIAVFGLGSIVGMAAGRHCSTRGSYRRPARVTSPFAARAIQFSRGTAGNARTHARTH